MDMLFPCMVAPPFGNPKLPDHHVPNWLGYVLEFQEMKLSHPQKKHLKGDGRDTSFREVRSLNVGK